MSNLTAAQTARANAALDKPRRIEGVVTSWRKMIDSGAFLSLRVDNNEYTLCTDTSATTGYIVPKMVANYANVPTLTRFIESGRIVSESWS